MSTSKHAFEQVKNILGKLDRFIDAARQRRLDPQPPVANGYSERADASRDTGPIRAEPGTPDPMKMQARPMRPAQPFGQAASSFAVRPDSRRA